MHHINEAELGREFDWSAVVNPFKLETLPTGMEVLEVMQMGNSQFTLRQVISISEEPVSIVQLVWDNELTFGPKGNYLMPAVPLHTMMQEPMGIRHFRNMVEAQKYARQCLFSMGPNGEAVPPPEAATKGTRSDPPYLVLRLIWDLDRYLDIIRVSCPHGDRYLAYPDGYAQHQTRPLRMTRDELLTVMSHPDMIELVDSFGEGLESEWTYRMRLQEFLHGHEAVRECVFAMQERQALNTPPDIAGLSIAE